MSGHYLAHLNVVRPVGAFSAQHEHAVYFFQQLQKVIAASKGFEGMRWHNHGVRTPEGAYLDLPQLVALQTGGTEENPHVMTMGGWDDVAAFHRFAHRLPEHVEGMKRIRDWVDRSEGPTTVMWWVEDGARVTLDQAWERLGRLRAEGPGPEAFTLQQRFDRPD